MKCENCGRHIFGYLSLTCTCDKKFCSKQCLDEWHENNNMHEVYPTKIKEIFQAVKENKIYYLCKKCHGKMRRNF
jgi:hypothetical protein